MNYDNAYLDGYDFIMKLADVNTKHANALVRHVPGAGTMFERLSHTVRGIPGRIRNSDMGQAMNRDNIKSNWAEHKRFDMMANKHKGITPGSETAADPAIMARSARHQERSTQHRNQALKGVAGWAGLGGAGTLGVGGVGAYAMGDANTYQNQAARFANNNMGTNFKTTSRLGNMFG